MKRRVQKHRKAKRDVLRVFVDIGQHNLDAAERFLISFNSDVRRLADMPGIGAKREFADPKLAHLGRSPSLALRTTSSSTVTTTATFRSSA